MFIIITTNIIKFLLNGGFQNRGEDNILGGSILGSPNFGKLPNFVFGFRVFQRGL